jgi:hypothetical protein
MACFNITKYGFLTIEEIMTDVIKEMTGNIAGGATNNIKYFTTKFNDVPLNGIGSTSQNVTILTTTANVDPLANVQQIGSYVSMTDPGWRICFNRLDDNRLAIHVATALQLTDTGLIAQLNNRGGPTNTAPVAREPAGNVGEDWTGVGGNPGTGAAGFNQIWLNRGPNLGAESAYPMSYTLTLTNRGFFLGIWEDSQEEVPQGTWDPINNPNPDGNYGRSPLRWILVQRSVDRLTGHVRGGGAMREDNNVAAETSRCPVYCVSGSGAPQKFQKFVVREVDVVSPSRKKVATVQSEDNPAMLNPYPQQSLTETGEFVVTFMNNLSTSRYKYADELDMLGTVAAEVVGAGTSVLVNVYNEPYQREYTALYATERFGQGMRLMVLTKTGYTPGASDPTNLTNNIAVENSHTIYTP